MVKLIWSTESGDELIAYCARVSNPKNREGRDPSKLLTYCAAEGHWSVFEMANMCVEITTSFPIGEQILRHRSFSFQKFSGRYAVFAKPVYAQARRQDKKNRQNSFNDMPRWKSMLFAALQRVVWGVSYGSYRLALSMGIAKESARFVLPLLTETQMYMNGTVRSWIHYLDQRLHPSAQAEHREVALQIKALLEQEFPLVYAAVKDRWSYGNIQ